MKCDVTLDISVTSGSPLVRVQKIKNKTNIISISVPKNMAMKVRSIKVEDKQNEG